MGDDLLKKICYYCEKPKCTYFCNGPCKRCFHGNCKGKIEEGWVSENGPIEDTKPQEAHLDDDRVKKLINITYTCNDCLSELAICFICKKKGKYSRNE